MVGSPIEVWHEKNLGLDSDVFFSFTNHIHKIMVGFSNPRSRSIVCGRVWKNGLFLATSSKIWGFNGLRVAQWSTN